MNPLYDFSETCRHCGQRFETDLRLFDVDPNLSNWTCACGTTNTYYGIGPMTIGYKLLVKSTFELVKRHDPPMAIVLAAMAVDSELSRAFKKWKAVRFPNVSDTEVTAELLRIRTSKKKLNEVLNLIGIPVADLQRSSSHLAPFLTMNGVRWDHLAEDMSTKLFKPRNRILHGGYVGFEEQEAISCRRVALAVLAAVSRADEIASWNLE